MDNGEKRERPTAGLDREAHGIYKINGLRRGFDTFQHYNGTTVAIYLTGDTVNIISLYLSFVHINLANVICVCVCKYFSTIFDLFPLQKRSYFPFDYS